MTMKFKGINDECKSDAMAIALEIALKKSRYKLLKKRVAWPRLKGQPVKIDCSKNACKNALFVVKCDLDQI